MYTWALDKPIATLSPSWFEEFLHKWKAIVMIKWWRGTFALPQCREYTRMDQSCEVSFKVCATSSVSCSRLFRSSCHMNSVSWVLCWIIFTNIPRCSSLPREDSSLLKYTLNCFVPLSLSISSLLLGALVPKLSITACQIVQSKCHFQLVKYQKSFATVTKTFTSLMLSQLLWRFLGYLYLQSKWFPEMGFQSSFIHPWIFHSSGQIAVHAHSRQSHYIQFDGLLSWMIRQVY